MAITSAMGKQKCPLATSGGGTTPHSTTSAKQYTNINVTITSVTKNNTKMWQSHQSQNWLAITSAHMSIQSDMTQNKWFNIYHKNSKWQ